MKKYLGFLLLAITTASLTACLKDGPVNLPPGGSPAVVEFSTNLFAAPTSDVNSPVALYVKSYEIKPSADMEVTLNYTGGVPAPQDITVNLDTVSNGKINQYNVYADENYELIDGSLYTLPSSVVIKKGENFAKFNVQLKTDQFAFDKAYVLPLHISSVSSGTISGNYGTILVAVGAKNQYDADYSATGVFHHPTAGDRPYANVNKHVATASLNSVSFQAGDIANNVTVNIDPATNQLTFSGGVSASQPFMPQPGQVNKYDPATKTFTLNYQYTGGGGMRIINEVLVRK